MKSAIVSFGTANPKYIHPQDNLAEIISLHLALKPVEKRLLKSVYRATGIEQRYSVLNSCTSDADEIEFFSGNPDTPFPSTAVRMKIYRNNAIHLALAAIENMNSDELEKITHVITVSCTGMYAPGIDIEIVQKLNLNSSTKRTSINFMGCYGAFNAIKVADAICTAEPNATVLVVCVEICTIHFQKGMSLDNIVANSIFADGAAAILIQGKSETKHKKYLTLEGFHCDLVPQTEQSMAWEIADSGFDIVLSSYVPDIINQGIEKFFQKLLHQGGLVLNDIDFFAIHPGGIKILHACEKALNLTPEHNKYSYNILKKYGNMSSATILFVLKAIWNDLASQDHHKNIFSCAFGPGLTLESMLLKAHHV
ncbi:MAG TPA: type III polyketide synthase [Gammaproteobacteria bacterium]|nr:type III polyketide synthase [Gammaproteobacteria bacterium]